MFVANLTADSERADPVLRSLYLPVHVVLAVFGYGALFVAFTMGVLYLFQERELLARSPRRFYYLIPSLERSDTIGGRSVVGGFGFLTLAIVTGFLWNHSLHGRYWTGDPKEWAALVAWAIYVAILVARWRWGWGGRRAAWLQVVGFTVVVFTFGWATLVPARGGGGAMIVVVGREPRDRAASPCARRSRSRRRRLAAALEQRAQRGRARRGDDPLDLQPRRGLRPLGRRTRCDAVVGVPGALPRPRRRRRSRSTSTGSRARRPCATRSGWRRASTRWCSASRRSWAR